MAWTSTNQLLTRNGSDILEYSPTQNGTHQGTSLAYGRRDAHDHRLEQHWLWDDKRPGRLYLHRNRRRLRAVQSLELGRPAQLMPGSVGGAGYGVTTMPDGRIAYSDGSGASNVYMYDPVLSTNTLIYSANYLIDGMVAGPLGNIAVTGQSNSTMTILTSTGSVVNSFATPHYPDGLAFSDSPLVSMLYSNNNDGTISKYVFGPGFTGAPVITDIATGSGAYGDLASVGPDCAFYVSQFDNFGYHGSTNGVGTNWDNAVTNGEPSIIRIGGGLMPDGTTVCEFYTPYGHNVPEPSTIGLLASGAVGLGLAARRRRRTR